MTSTDRNTSPDRSAGPASGPASDPLDTLRPGTGSRPRSPARRAAY
ncbi:hypothetical protein [Streptomyces sp. E-08]